MRPDTSFIDLVSTSRTPRWVLLFSRFLFSNSWVGVCRDSSTHSEILERRCRGMKLRERQTMLLARHVRRRWMRRRRRKCGSAQSCSAGSAERIRTRKRHRVMTMTTMSTRRRNGTTFPGTSWRAMTTWRHPLSHRRQRRLPPTLRLPRHSKGRLRARRRRRWIATPHRGLPCGWGVPNGSVPKRRS
jgi:hypothetical protein